MTDTAVRPIFLVGAPRSGTTMLRYMLCGHSKIYIPPESNFIPRVFSRPTREALDHQRATDAVRTIEGYRVFFKDWSGDLPDPEVLVAELPSLSPASIVDAVYSRYASQFGASRWGDKSPIYACHIDLLARMFPRAQFVHIVRDGRDVALSMLKSYTTRRFFYVDAYYAARTWQHHVQAAQASGARLGPERYLELRYEELVRRPEALLERICAFLGETYEPAMAHPEEVARRSYHSKGIHAATREAVTPDHAGGWRSRMSDPDRYVIETAVGELLVELGYEPPERSRVAWSHRVRYGYLRLKFAVTSAGRSVLRALGVFHPTQALTRYLRLRPYAKQSGERPAAPTSS